VLEPLLEEVEALNERIKEYDRRIEQIAKESYPEVSLLQQVKGVGTQIALTYILTIEDPHRFRKSRDAGCFLGLRPGRRNSGQSEPQMHISKEGDHNPVRAISSSFLGPLDYLIAAGRNFRQGRIRLLMIWKSCYRLRQTPLFFIQRLEGCHQGNFASCGAT
jgi:hypothetical protein